MWFSLMCVFLVITFAGLIILPRHLKLWDPPIEIDEENTHLLKQAQAMKRRRNQRRNNNVNK